MFIEIISNGFSGSIDITAMPTVYILHDGLPFDAFLKGQVEETGCLIPGDVAVMVTAEVGHRQRLQFFQASQILRHICIHGREAEVLVRNPCGIGGEYGLHARLVGGNGTVGMTRCIQDQQADTAKVYLISFG